MEFEELVINRKSIRKFTEAEVDHREIMQMLRIATRAANAGNEQSWRFYLVTSRSVIDSMAGAVEEALDRLATKAGMIEQSAAAKKGALIFKGTPGVLGIAATRRVSTIDKMLAAAGYDQNYADLCRCRPELQSAGACIQLFCLAAEEKGYGCCWLTAPMIARPDLEAILGVQPPMALIALVAIGRPAENPAPRPRKPVEDLVSLII